MAFAENTVVPVEKSRAEIERLLSRHKCSAFMAGVNHETHRATVQFKAHNRIIKFELALPNPADPKYRKIKNSYLQRTASGVAKVVEQEERTRWRALLLVIKAKLEAVESQIATFEDEFLAHVLLPNQQTVAEYVGPMVQQVYETGRMPVGRQLTAGDVEAEVG
jgi:ribonucleotide reductase alpha subunit